MCLQISQRRGRHQRCVERKLQNWNLLQQELLFLHMQNGWKQYQCEFREEHRSREVKREEKDVQINKVPGLAGAAQSRTIKAKRSHKEGHRENPFGQGHVKRLKTKHTPQTHEQREIFSEWIQRNRQRQKEQVRGGVEWAVYEWSVLSRWRSEVSLWWVRD